MDMKRLLTLIILCISCVGVQIASAQARLIAVEARHEVSADTVAHPVALKSLATDSLTDTLAGVPALKVDTIALRFPVDSKKLKKQQRDLQPCCSKGH